MRFSWRWLPLNRRVGIQGLVFKESDIHGGEEFLVDGKVTLIPLLICRIIKENTIDSTRIKFTVVMLVKVNKQ